MLYVYEFEFYKSGNSVVAYPFEVGEGTFGDDLRDAVECAADWLSGFINDHLVSGNPLPTPEFGHLPRFGGTIIAVAVDCDLSKIEAVSAADAARILGVSTARVAQMCEAGKLESWREGSSRRVTRGSLDARLLDAPKAGRPKKAAMA
ncbi:MAG: helix-turn-helix domain-containing protein [Clostridia bacterium]